MAASKSISRSNTPADCGGVAPLGSFPVGFEVQCPFDSIDSTKKPINFTWWWPLVYDSLDAVEFPVHLLKFVRDVLLDLLKAVSDRFENIVEAGFFFDHMLERLVI